MLLDRGVIMYELKTKKTGLDVVSLIESNDDDVKKRSAYKLIDIMENITGEKPKIWGTDMIGFGEYTYKYPSGHGGTMPLAAFALRKANVTIYFLLYGEVRDRLLSKLGKHKASKGCIYIKNIDDIDTNVLTEIIKESIAFVSNEYKENSL